MRALVVYESMFGNTKAIAEAVAEGLGRHVRVDTVEVGAAPTALDEDVALLVVGGPTHAHGMTTPDSRAGSVDRAGGRLVSPGIGMREFIEAVAGGSRKVPVAVFDTRIKGPGILWGSAAKSAAKQLQGAGFAMVASPEDFLVDGPTGPVFDRLHQGELERARAWGDELGARIAARARGLVTA